MIRLAVTEARAHARRLLLVAVAIAVAVTFMSGTFVLADSVQTTTVAQASVQPPGLAVAVYGDGSLPARTAADIAGVPGVARVAPVAAGYAQMVAGGRLIGTTDSVVVSVSRYPDLQVGHLVAGHMLTGGGQVVVQSATFDSEHFHLGQHVQVVSSVPARDLHHRGRPGRGVRPRIARCHGDRCRLLRRPAADRTPREAQRGTGLRHTGGDARSPGFSTAAAAGAIRPGPHPLPPHRPGRGPELVPGAVVHHHPGRSGRHRPGGRHLHHRQCLLAPGGPTSSGTGLAPLPRDQPRPTGSAGHRRGRPGRGGGFRGGPRPGLPRRPWRCGAWCGSRAPPSRTDHWGSTGPRPWSAWPPGPVRPFWPRSFRPGRPGGYPLWWP